MSNFNASTGTCSSCNQTDKQENLCFDCQINQAISVSLESQKIAFPVERYSQITYHVLEPKNGFDGMGISMNDSYLITSIDPESPAELCGLRPSLSLVEINGKNISAQSFEENIKLMKESFTKNKNLIIGVIDTLEETKQKNDSKENSCHSQPVKKTRSDCAVCLNVLFFSFFISEIE